MAKQKGSKLQTKYVVMFRDPRSTYASAMKFPTWAVSSVDYVCEALNLQLKTLPSLISAAGKENVLPVIFEDWAADVPKFVLKLQQFLGIGEMPAEWKSHKTTPKSVWEWQQKLADYDIQKIQNNQACKDYMTQMNYPNGKPDSYAGVKREF